MADYIDPNVFWVVNNKKYYRKIDALIAAQKQNKDVSFNYYNDRFEDFQWDIEPKESFEDLCYHRAQQLRDTSSYIRLWYSGGADSHTVLRTFMDNNIHIDEIVNVRASPVDDFDGISNQEQNLRSLPYLRSIQKTIPKTKMSLVHVTAEQYMNYYKDDTWHTNTPSWDFGDDPGLILNSPESIGRHTKLVINSTITEITGDEKPKVGRQDGMYYTPFVDSSFQYMYWENAHNFYTSPDFPVLHSKQCHELKHILEQRFPDGEDIPISIYNQDAIDPDFKREWYHCCRTIIGYEVDMGKSWGLLSPKSQLRRQDAIQHNPELLKYYEGSLKELREEIPHYWRDPNFSLPGITSQIHLLGP